MSAATDELVPAAAAEAPSRPHPRTLLPAELLPHLSQLQTVESSLSHALSLALADRSVLAAAHSRLAALLPRIDAVDLELSGHQQQQQQGGGGGPGAGDKAGLKGRIEVVNDIAERVGGKVRGLDLELKRVREANDRLNEVMELKVRPTRSPALRSSDGEGCGLTPLRWLPLEPPIRAPV